MAKNILSLFNVASVMNVYVIIRTLGCSAIICNFVSQSLLLSSRLPIVMILFFILLMMNLGNSLTAFARNTLPCFSSVSEFRRKRGLSTDFKWFVTSEYGPLTLRPHLHGLLHGIHLLEFKSLLLPGVSPMVLLWLAKLTFSTRKMLWFPLGMYLSIVLKVSLRTLLFY